MVDMPVIVRHQDRGALRLARAVRPRWRPLLAGGVLTVVGAMASGAWGARFSFLESCSSCSPR